MIEHWLERRVDLESMRALARRVVAVVRELDGLVAAVAEAPPGSPAWPRRPTCR